MLLQGYRLWGAHLKTRMNPWVMIRNIANIMAKQPGKSRGPRLQVRQLTGQDAPDED